MSEYLQKNYECLEIKFTVLSEDQLFLSTLLKKKVLPLLMMIIYWSDAMEKIVKQVTKESD